MQLPKQSSKTAEQPNDFLTDFKMDTLRAHEDGGSTSLTRGSSLGE